MKSDLKCEVVKDLLPGFAEKLTSDVTNSEIEEHLAECRSCTSYYKTAKASDRVSRSDNEKDLRFLKRIKRKHLITAIIAVILVPAILVLSFNFLHSKQVVIPADTITDSEIYLLKSGDIYCFYHTSGDIAFSEGSFTTWYTQEGDSFTGTTSATHSLFDKWFGERSASGAFLLFDTSDVISIVEGKIVTKGTIVLTYQGENSSDIFTIWNSSDPIAMAPAKIENFVKVQAEYANQNFIDAAAND